MNPLLVALRVAALALCAGIAIAGQSPQSVQLALVGGTVYPSPTDAPIRDAVVLIDRGRIAAVGRRSALRPPRQAEVIDCTGLTITAGFWNSHVHFLERKWTDAAALPAEELDRQIQAMLTRYGFTSVFDTWSMWDNTRRIRDRIEAGDLAGPRIRSTGEATFPNALAAAPPPAQAAWGALGFMPLDRFRSARGSEVADAVAAARALLESGTDGLKLYAMTVGRNGVALPDAVIQAVVKEAHSKGKPVFAHPTTEGGLMASVRAGADVLAHATPQTGPWNDAVLSAMKQSGIALIPTLMLWRYELRHERVSAADRFEETAVDQLRAWVRAGGTVLFGTDVGYMHDYDPADEYTLMQRAGMTLPQTLASLTTAPAERFGVASQLGRIAPGFAADLTVLRQDPSRDIRALANVAYTIRDGRVIYRGTR